MVVSNRGAGFGWGGALDDDIHKLVEMVTELGIEVEDILFNAVTALLGEGIHGAQQAQQAGNECEARYQLAHQLGLELIMDGRASADQARWIMELQELGRAFRRIAQEATWIAIQSLALQIPADDVLAQVGASMNLLEYLVEQTRMQVRNAIIFSTSRDRKYARRILDEATDLLRAYNVLDTRVQAAIGEHPRDSFPMQQLLGIATRLENIGKLCSSIASAVLYDPPSQY
jgi:phosphate uptake regulator